MLFYVRLQQAELLECDLGPNFTLSLEQLNTAWRPNCKLIMLCNPNNPTGTIVASDFIATVCETYRDHALIVVDEAYIEFADIPSATNLINQYDNLIVLRTLSKAYGLAGIRLGCVIAQSPIIETINKITAPYSISSATLGIAQKALRNKEWFVTALNKIKRERKHLTQQLKKCSWIDKVYPSQTNFILIKTPKAQELASFLAKNDIAIRQFSCNSLLHQHLRITVGGEEQNNALIDLLSSFKP